MIAIFSFISIILVLSTLLQSVSAYSNSLISRNLIVKNAVINKLSSFYMSSSEPELDIRTREKIDKLVNSNKVLLFMKGNKLFPQCGFSNNACRCDLLIMLFIRYF